MHSDEQPVGLCEQMAEALKLADTEYFDGVWAAAGSVDLGSRVTDEECLAATAIKAALAAYERAPKRESAQHSDEQVVASATRVQAYLDAKKEVSGLHPEVIHVIHASGGKHELNVSDLEALLSSRREVEQPVDSSPLLPPWFDIAIAPKNGATILGMYAAKESYLGDDGPRHHIVRWFDSEKAFCTIDGKGDPERQPTLTHWQPLTYLHVLYGHTVYPVPSAYYAYPLPDEWRQSPKRESVGRDFMLEAQSVLINVRQFLSGWHQDGTAWSEWDRDVEAAVGKLQMQIEEYLNG